MNPNLDYATKVHLIKSRLQQALQPDYLKVIDDSEQHRGHAGHQGGGRHFTIVIRAESLINLTRVSAHRRIYDILHDLLQAEIHALSIRILPAV